MILGVGLDVVAVARIDDLLARRGERFLERVFTPAERAACEGRVDRSRALAARFAAKEAGMKALGTGWSGGVGWQDFEVTGGGGAPPRLALSGAAADRSREMGVERVHLSLSHDGGVAAAVVILEGGRPP